MLTEAVQVRLPTRHGLFDAHAFEPPSGFVYVALVAGDVVDAYDVLVRVHSECLTGDVFGSLRCDCGVQLRQSLRMISAEGRGVVVYATGHEGRGIGLVNKLRAYLEQDGGADTVDANHALGLPADLRHYDDAALVVSALGIRSIRLVTNNAAKVEGLRAAGIHVSSVVPLPTTPHHRNARYLSTKAARMRHVQPAGPPIEGGTPDALDVISLLGAVRHRTERPWVVLKYAQTLDGRISTVSGDARWISGEPERRVSHALRASCDAVLVGVGTVLTDDPQLTVRMVPGASPTRVVLDSRLRIPDSANVLDDQAPTVVLTTEQSDPARRAELRARGVVVEVATAGPEGVAVPDALARLRALGVEVLMVEGGARVNTSLLAARLVDRLLVAVAPLVMGRGISGVGDLGVRRVPDAIRLRNQMIVPVGDNVLLGWDVDGQESVPD
jgi:3,4-dihydroxy 2-butanone 4-phosphate synthase/GTP cyclohydrolase II